MTDVQALAYDDHTFDRRLRIVVVLVAALLVVVLAFAAIAIPTILTSANNTDSVKRGNDISACRAIANSKLADITANVQDDRTALEILTNVGLEASVKRDIATLEDAVAKSPQARAQLTADTKALHDATAEYVQVVKDSQKNPDAFLERCHQENPS